jgi:DNA replication licensing factor MCM5
MRLSEALRLFKVSTMAANAAYGYLQHGTGGVFSSNEDLSRVESFLRSRLVVGALLNKQRIIEEAASQGYNAMMVARVIGIMAMRGELQERNQSRLIKRIK